MKIHPRSQDNVHIEPLRKLGIVERPWILIVRLLQWTRLPCIGRRNVEGRYDGTIMSAQ
jgi:hypothetical protein